MALLLIAGVNAVLVIGPFQRLVIIDVLLMVASYALIFIAAVRLRAKEPGLIRPFTIPGGTCTLVILIVPPLCLIAFMMSITITDQSIVLWGLARFNLLGLGIGWYGIAGLVALLSGPVLYPLLARDPRPAG